MELVFCTSNAHKLSEVTQILGNEIAFLTLTDIAYFDEIPEPFNTLEENSMAKAVQVFQQTGRDCFAEDTGLFIEALDGEPGVFSARYAGEPSDAQKNIEKVLEKMQGIENRNAFFKTVITLIIDGEAKQFEGRCDGSISTQESGVKGFGYDPVFMPDGAGKSFAEHTPEEKNAVSHRRKAFDLLATYLKGLSK